MRYHEPPRRNFFSYILPFLVIIILGLSAFFGVREYLYSSIFLKSHEMDSYLHIGRIQGVSAYIIPWATEQREPLTQLTKIGQGDIITTEKGSRVELLLFDGGVIRLNQDTTVVFSRLDSERDTTHVSLTLTRGEIYVHAAELLNESSDFIVISPQTISQANDVTFVVDTFPTERLEVVEGVLRTSVFHLKGDRKEPLTKLTARIGEEIVLDAETFTNLLDGIDYYPSKISNREVAPSEVSEIPWYSFSDVQELESLALLSKDEQITSLRTSATDLEKDTSGSVVVQVPAVGSTVGLEVLVSGKYSQGVRNVFVNDKPATLDPNLFTWNIIANLGADDTHIHVVSEDEDGVKRLVESRQITIDNLPPRSPEFLQPQFDAQLRASILDESVVITGRAHSDIATISVVSDSQPAYQLKKYTQGDELFYYRAAKDLGNLHDGRNVYTFQFFDAFGNVVSKTVNIFANVPLDTGNDVPFIVLNEPFVSSPYHTTQSILHITARVSPDIKKIYLNESPVDYDPLTFILDLSVEPQLGENPLIFSAETHDGILTDVLVYTIIRESDTE